MVNLRRCGIRSKPGRDPRSFPIRDGLLHNPAGIPCEPILCEQALRRLICINSAGSRFLF
jgi:hypothetical protein